MERQAFYIYKRRRGKQDPIFYVQFRGADGVLGKSISTQQTSKAAATTWVACYLAENNDRQTGAASGTFGDFARGWWVPETCPYVRAKRARGFHISDSYIDFRRNNLKLHVLPIFGEVRLTEITPRMIEDWVLGWYETKTSAPATINRALGTLKLMLKEAVRLGYLNGNPAAAVGELKETPAERGTLTLAEMLLLFNVHTIDTVWSNHYHFAANILAAWSGMRLGEVQALQRRYVFPHHVEIVHSWHDHYGLTQPKWNSVRISTIPARVSAALFDVMEENPYKDPETLVFAASRPDQPLSKTALLGQYRHALVKIGIDAKAQQERGLCFHSWRHGLNSLMRGQVGDEMIRRVLGHKTPAMTEGYDHVTPELLAPVLAAQERLFNGEA